jgi:hypothetical protein
LSDKYSVTVTVAVTVMISHICPDDLRMRC